MSTALDPNPTPTIGPDIRAGQDEIEASRAPLIEHLIELRSRIIKAVAAFIVNDLRVLRHREIHLQHSRHALCLGGGRGEKAPLIYTHPLEYFFVQLKLAVFGGAFLAFPVIATQIYKFVAPGLYKDERDAFRPYLIATPLFFAARHSDGDAGGDAAADEVLARHAAGRDRGCGLHLAPAEGG